MQITVLYNEVADDAPIDERDVLEQARAVSIALRELGHEPICVPCDAELKAAKALDPGATPLAFNLIEAPGGINARIHEPAELLESMGIPFTGSSSCALRSTTDKLLAKKLLREARLPTPPGWKLDAAQTGLEPESAADGPFLPGLYIIKPIGEDASVGLNDEAVVRCGNPERLRAQILDRSERFNEPCFAEKFIDGREFNLSLLMIGARVETLPPAELLFNAFPKDKPRIAGYKSKWETDSFEYNNTPRRFDFQESDRDLLKRLKEMARACWSAFKLSDYARVDFRVDNEGRPWILEANANPCLSPDAGFAAASEKAGLAYDNMIGFIVESALGRAGRSAAMAG